jgi:hypothetical protein
VQFNAQAERLRDSEVACVPFGQRLVEFGADALDFIRTLGLARAAMFS